MAIDFSNIPKNLPQGENMGGITQKVYFAFYADVDTWPTKPTSPTTLAANAVLTGDVVMKAGKGFYELYITDDTGEFNIETVGEKDGKSFVQHLSFFHPGFNTNIVGLMNVAKNENLVFIVEDNNGIMFLMGDDSRPATLEGSPDGAGTGKETSARRGISMEFTYKTSNNYIYAGTIPLASGASV
jgi:hypothetical protein